MNQPDTFFPVSDVPAVALEAPKKQKRRAGMADMEAALKTKWRGKTLEQRLFSNIEADSISGCWLWTGCFRGDGRGTIYCGGKSENSARVMWAVLFGNPGKIGVLHRCDNGKCVNPFHLFLGTQKDNVADMMAKGRHVSVRGVENFFAKLTDDIVIEIRRIHSERKSLGLEFYGDTIRSLSKRLDVSESVIRNAVKRITWKHVK